MTAFAVHMQALAQEFIGTVLFVDDQILGTQKANDADETNNELDEALIEVESLQSPDENVSDIDHSLYLGRLSQACSDMGMLCSPVFTSQISSEQEKNYLVDKVIMLSNKADVIVLDWEMEVPSGSIDMGATAQSIVEKLKSINKDRELLVCIFSAADVDKINPDALSGEHVIVFYVNKNEKMAYEGLPDLICKKFSDVHSGLMPAAALSAIKVVRDNSHRLLFKYSSDNDAAYLSHRCLVENIDDAELFVTELLAASFGDLVRGNNTVIETVNDQKINSWMELRSVSFKDSNFEIPGVIKRKITNKTRKEWLNKGISSWLIKICESRKDSKTVKQKMKKWDSSHSLSLVEYFQENIDLDKTISIEAAFSRLASHIFFDESGKKINSNFVTLGSVIKNNKSKDKYYLCLQPVCDSVRLVGSKIPFLFLSLKPCEKPSDARGGFHIVVKDNDKDVFLKISEKNSHLKVIEFTPDPLSKKVNSKTNDLVNGYVNSQVIEFKLLAQLRREHAHRISTKFIHNITRVGLNEPEWLRRHGTA
ncbi:MAG: hypothetical protein JJE30_15670 [Desulfuromonadales bacterium]|nr:hypothetical protein [Desulfuromonadales bacterium]